MGDENKTRDVVDAVAGLAAAIPVYQDAVQPAAKEIGTALATVAKTVHIILAPVSAMVWGYDQIKDFVSTKVAEKLKNVPPEDLVTPKPNVAGPALEALRYTGHENSLSDLYAGLLASAMDKKTAEGAHPAFVEIIKQLTPDEARLMAYILNARILALINIDWAHSDKPGGGTVIENVSVLGELSGCEFPDLTPSYIDNLCRLGLAEIPFGKSYTADENYVPLLESKVAKAAVDKIDSTPGQKSVIDKKVLQVTSLGRQFGRICVAR